MTEERKTPVAEEPAPVEELTPEQIEQIIGGAGAGKVYVGGLARPPLRDDD